ncbi:helix-turn-helix transcriptional regulator [Hyunsoonleella sp. 2307UL5-6]|uniref:helix-turn-helix transcriptional regulator n=1 Tax=Hyunsoonleella sp. 2307UL5-6 TaxID=3384768 RepID=UPI0039BD5EB5
MKKKIEILFILFFITQLSTAQKDTPYIDYIKKANNSLHLISNESQSFLDSIPRPLENYIEGHVDDYYIMQGHIYGSLNNDINAVQSFNKALAYAENENDYLNAGDACIQLYRLLISVSKDSLAIDYLNKAKINFKKCNDIFGLYEIELIEAYAKYIDGEFTESINFLLPKLDKYEAVKSEDAYLFMDAVSQVTLNYIGLDSINLAHKYFKIFNTSIEVPTVNISNYKAFKAAINLELANYFSKQKKIDSCTFYLNKGRDGLPYLDQTYINLYYNLNIDLNNTIKNFKLSNLYLDSLRSFENEISNSNLKATNDISNSIRVLDNKFKAQRIKGKRSLVILLLILLVFFVLSLLYFYFYKKQKYKLNKVSRKIETLSYVKSNNEQLAIKIHGLEEYIKNIKLEIKDIASIKCLENQKSHIRDFYTSLHINSSTILDKSDNHLELINDLNIDFFKKVEVLYPQLNKSEIIICYYLLLGFINKEIAVFLNTSIRSVESKRYRISKKINFDKNKFNLLQYLQLTFKDELHYNS